MAANRRKFGDGAMKLYTGKSGKSEICPIFGGHTNFYGKPTPGKNKNGRDGDFVGSISSCECCEDILGKATLRTVWYSKAYDSAARR